MMWENLAEYRCPKCEEPLSARPWGFKCEDTLCGFSIGTERYMQIRDDLDRKFAPKDEMEENLSELNAL
jgi:hypothetical protein